MEDHIIWFGRHEGWLRQLSHGLRNQDSQCIDLAYRMFDLMIPSDCIVIPMPSHDGRATYMYRVASKLCIKDRSRDFQDILWCDPHESHYIVKKEGGTPPPLKMNTTLGQFSAFNTDAKRVYVIDNTIGTGNTARAALDALRHRNPGETFVCALTH